MWLGVFAETCLSNPSFPLPFFFAQIWNLRTQAVDGSFSTGETVSHVAIRHDGSVLSASGRKMQLYQRRDEAEVARSGRDGQSELHLHKGKGRPNFGYVA